MLTNTDRKLFKIHSPDGKAEAFIASYGAALLSLKLPSTKKETGEFRDVVLGYEELTSYEINEPSLGVIVGRVAGRISNATFSIHNNTHEVTKNLQNQHCLHGGKKGLYHVNWGVLAVNNQSVTLNYTSPPAEDGFPGSMHVEVTYTLDQLAEKPVYSLTLNYKASMRQAPGPINITNHSYFNLAGHDQGRAAICKHRVQIAGNKTLVLEKETLLPTGEVIETQGEQCLTTETVLAPGIEKGGYDLFLIFDDDQQLSHEYQALLPRCQFSALDPESGRKMLGSTDQVGVQFYTADCIKPHQPNGKHGKPYEAFGAICFETQAHPNAVNLPEETYKMPNVVHWPNSEPYQQKTTYYFFDTNAVV